MTAEECRAWAKIFSPILAELRLERSRQRWSDAEFVARYLETGFTAAGLWKKGSRWPAPENLKMPSGPLKIWSEFLFRGLPLAVNQALLSWHRGIYPLHLCEGVPGTEEVLDWQTRGERCVSCLTDEALLSDYVLGERDPLSFVLHDLIHAQHFFKDPQMARVQTGFSRLMREIARLPEVARLLRTDAIFEREFSYGATDMNSHGAHLLKYLKAVAVFAAHRNKLDPEAFCHGLFQGLDTPATIQLSWRRLNTTDETAEDFSVLQAFLFDQSRMSSHNDPEPLLWSVSFR